LKILFVVNDDYAKQEIIRCFESKDFFGDEIEIISIGEDFDRNGWLVIEDSDSKKDAMVMDLVGNYLKHGNPMNPNVKESKEKDPEMNICDSCFELVDPELEICPSCGASMLKAIEDRKKNEKEVEDRRLELQDIDFDKVTVKRKWEKKNHITKKGTVGTLYCVRISKQSMPLFRFSGITSRNKKTQESFDKLEVGSKYELTEDSYGTWLKV